MQNSIVNVPASISRIQDYNRRNDLMISVDIYDLYLDVCQIPIPHDMYIVFTYMIFEHIAKISTSLMDILSLADYVYIRDDIMTLVDIHWQLGWSVFQLVDKFDEVTCCYSEFIAYVTIVPDGAESVEDDPFYFTE